MVKKFIRKWLIKFWRASIYLNPFNKPHQDLFTTKIHWNCYVYLKRKYKKILNNMEIYKGSGETSNKIWWCWLQGEENAPALNRACLASLRRYIKDREIVIVTNENVDELIEIPQYIKEKHDNGIIPHAQYSDLIRLELLIKYGGTWIDSSVLCTKTDTTFFDRPLFVFENWMKNDGAIIASNWFITSEINNPILITTRNLLYSYWKRNNKMVHYYIFHFFFSMAAEKYFDLWKKVPRFSNVPPHVLQFEITDSYNKERFNQITQMSSFHKLNHKANFSKVEKNSFYEYILKEYNTKT